MSVKALIGTSWCFFVFHLFVSLSCFWVFSFNSGISLKNENNIITLHEFKVVAKQFLNSIKLLFENFSLFKYIYIQYMTQVTLNESLIPRLTKKRCYLWHCL